MVVLMTAAAVSAATVMCCRRRPAEGAEAVADDADGDLDDLDGLATSTTAGSNASPDAGVAAVRRRRENKSKSVAPAGPSINAGGQMGRSSREGTPLLVQHFGPAHPSHRTRRRRGKCASALRILLVFMSVLLHHVLLAGHSYGDRRPHRLMTAHGGLPGVAPGAAVHVRPKTARFGTMRALYDLTGSLVRNRWRRQRDAQRLNSDDPLFRRAPFPLSLWQGKREGLMDLQGKNCVVTGANTGIGLQVAVGLAARGANVILACRDQAKAEQARSYILDQVGGGSGSVDVLPLDLASLQSVDDFVDNLRQKHENISVLVNNAGYGGGGEGGMTKDGVELNYGVNFLAHYKLTLLLLPALYRQARAQGEASRVINLSSAVHWLASYKTTENLDRTVWRSTDRTNDGGEYKRSKLFMLMLSRGLNRRLKTSGLAEDIISSAVNPGAVCSDIWRNAPDKRQWQVRNLYPGVLKTCQQGALSVLAALRKDVAPGSLVVDETPSAYSSLADDPELDGWLWKTAENATGSP